MGLRHGDLRDMVYDVFEVDAFKSKMGSDKDIVTISFSAKDKQAADDLMNFLEKGYGYILDADVTPGEQSDGTYKVFVEIERNSDVPKQIIEIVDGVKKLSEINDMKFRYYKNFKSLVADETNLSEIIPLDSNDYDITVNESNMSNFKNFFNRSYVESIDMWDDVLTISKKYADPVHFKFVDFGEKNDILNNLTESLNFNDFGEVIFLSKYIGDYNITKYGDKLTFENAGHTLVLKRL